MAVQTTYSINHNAAYAGMKADQQINNTVSKLNKGVVTILPGKGVVTDGVNGAALPTISTVPTEFVGVVMRELNRAIADGDLNGAVPSRDFTTITHGAVWVTAADVVFKDDDVFLRIGATATGDFGNTAGTGATLSVALPGVKVLTPGNVGDLIQISIGIGG